MHTITTRTPTPDEQKIVDSPGIETIGTCGCVFILLVIFPTMGIGVLTALLASIYYDDTVKFGLIAAGITATIAFTVLLFSYVPYLIRQHRMAVKDSQAQTIEEIYVSNPRVIEIRLINDNEPILIFDIGDNKILFLQGQWLRDEDTYGAEPLKEDEREDDAFEEYINGLPEPYSFPSSEFTVSRFPNSKRVTSIRVTGTYIVPKAEVDALKFEYEFGDCELLEGCLDDITDILAREHINRKNER